MNFTSAGRIRKAASIVFIFFIFPSFLFALKPLEKEFPEPYKILRDKVYETNGTEQEIAALCSKVQDFARKNYSGDEQLILLALSDYMKGLDYYYRRENKKAADCFESGMKLIDQARKIKDSAIAITVYTKLLLQMASVKTLAYMIKYVPKIPDMCDQAIALNPAYTAAYQMKYAISCFAPPPYGNYKEGAKNMLTLYDDRFEKEKDDYFSIACAAAYALSKSNQKQEAIKWYKYALTIYPHNFEAADYLKALEK